MEEQLELLPSSVLGVGVLPVVPPTTLTEFVRNRLREFDGERLPAIAVKIHVPKRRLRLLRLPATRHVHCSSVEIGRLCQALGIFAKVGDDLIRPFRAVRACLTRETGTSTSIGLRLGIKTRSVDKIAENDTNVSADEVDVLVRHYRLTLVVEPEEAEVNP